MNSELIKDQTIPTSASVNSNRHHKKPHDIQTLNLNNIKIDLNKKHQKLLEK